MDSSERLISFKLRSTAVRSVFVVCFFVILYIILCLWFNILFILLILLVFSVFLMCELFIWLFRFVDEGRRVGIKFTTFIVSLFVLLNFFKVLMFFVVL